MRLAWLVPAGLSATGLLIGILAATRGRNTLLGRTARKGPRTGAIEVDPAVVRDRTETILKRMSPCGDDGDWLRPSNQGAAAPVMVQDAATGAPRMVRVLLRPEAKPPGNVGGGYLETVYDDRRDEIRQDVVLTLSSNACAMPRFWRDLVGDVLHHELAHAADPALVLEARGTRRHRPTRVGTGEYYNSPAEMTAQVAEVERQLRHYGLETITLYPPVEMLRRGSSKFQKMEPYLSPKNRRRFLKLAARLIDEHESR